jgi:hypothetical protein
MGTNYLEKCHCGMREARILSVQKPELPLKVEFYDRNTNEFPLLQFPLHG